MPDGDQPGPPGGRAAATLPQREGGAAGHRPGRARGRLGSWQFDDAFTATIAGRLGPAACGRLEQLLSRPNVLAGLKSDPGPLGLDTLLAEIGKLSTVRALGLDEAVFGGASDRIVA